MSDLHIDDFFHDGARTLVSLLRVFPRPVAIYAEDICGADEPDEYGLHSQRYQACFATFLWLGEEGFVRFSETINQDAIDQAVLTAPCFNALIKPRAEAVDEDLPLSVRLHRSSAAYVLEQALHHHDHGVTQQYMLLLMDEIAISR